MRKSQKGTEENCEEEEGDRETDEKGRTPWSEEQENEENEEEDNGKD